VNVVLIGSLLINIILLFMYFDERGNSDHIAYVIKQHEIEMGNLRQEYSRSRAKLLQMWEEERKNRKG
jgi:hypothetical protein